MADVLIECVPNFSEGADPRKVASIVSAMQLDGVSLLDWSLDADHNRSVVTIVWTSRRSCRGRSARSRTSCRIHRSHIATRCPPSHRGR